MCSRVSGGSGSSTSADNTAVPLFVDEYSTTTGSLVSTVAIPTGASGFNARCVLSYWGTSGSTTASDEGLPSTTADGTALLFPCNDAALASVPNSGTNRVVGVVYANGTVDTRTRITNWCV